MPQFPNTLDPFSPAAAAVPRRTPRARRRPSLRAFVLFAGAYLLALLSRLPALLVPPSAFFYNLDELDLSLSCLDRFLGSPSTILMEPSSILQFLYLPVSAIDYVLKFGIPASLDRASAGLAVYISQACTDPRHTVFLARLIVVLITSAAPLLVYWISRRLGASRLLGVICAAAVSIHPAFYRQSVMAAGDSVAVTLALAAIACVLGPAKPWRAALTGFLCAAAVAAKIAVASLAALPLLLLLFEDPGIRFSRRLKDAALFCSALAAGFVFWCPYIWTDPVRFAKAVGGNINKPGASFDLHVFAAKWMEAHGFAFACLFIATLVAAVCLLVVRRIRRQVAIPLFAAALIATPLLLRATTTYSRYHLPFLPCMLMLIATAASAARVQRKLSIAVTALLIASLGGAAAATASREFQLRLPDDLTDAAVIIQNLPEQTVLFLPEELLTTFRVHLPREVYERMLRRAADRLRENAGTLEFMESRGIRAEAARVLVTDFNEDEQAATRHLAAQATYASPGVRKVFIYYNPENYGKGLVVQRTSFADTDLTGALAQIRSHQNAAILLPHQYPPLGSPIWSGRTQWHWYWLKGR